MEKERDFASILRDDAELLANNVYENTWDIAEHLINAADIIEDLLDNLSALQEKVDSYSELLYG